MTRPMFSVIVPTLGRPSLPKTLASCQRPDVQTIVVADSYPLDTESYDESVVRVNEIAAVARAHGARFLAHNATYHDTGSPQLQLGYAEATGAFIQNLGDDDVMEPFAFETMRQVIESLAEPVPLMFRTALHPTWPDPRRGQRNIAVLWQDAVIRDQNVTGQCFVIPNDQARIGSWLINKDIGFITDTVRLWDGRVEWRTEIISQCF